VHNCRNETLRWDLCNKDFFKNIKSFKGLSAKGSENVIQIFKEYSYCIPNGFYFNLRDNDDKKSDFISSLSLRILDTYQQPNTNAQKTRRVLLSK
jgi:hypothetical protein